HYLLRAARRLSHSRSFGSAGLKGGRGPGHLEWNRGSYFCSCGVVCSSDWKRWEGVCPPACPFSRSISGDPYSYSRRTPKIKKTSRANSVGCRGTAEE